MRGTIFIQPRRELKGEKEETVRKINACSSLAPTKESRQVSGVHTGFRGGSQQVEERWNG